MDDNEIKQAMDIADYPTKLADVIDARELDFDVDDIRLVNNSLSPQAFIALKKLLRSYVEQEARDKEYRIGDSYDLGYNDGYNIGYKDGQASNE